MDEEKHVYDGDIKISFKVGEEPDDTPESLLEMAVESVNDAMKIVEILNGKTEKQVVCTLTTLISMYSSCLEYDVAARISDMINRADEMMDKEEDIPKC